MEMPESDADDLVEFWTLLDEDRALLGGRRGATALGFALLLKFYSRHGRFPRGWAEIPETVIGFVSRQVGVEIVDLASYEWSGRTVEYHRAEIREHLGFRLATVADQQLLTSWLAVSVAHAERRPDRVREALLGNFRRERIEAPTTGRVQRMVRSALRTAEQTWTARICDRLGDETRARLLALIAFAGAQDTDESEGDQDGEAAGATVLGLIKSEPGNVSLESMMTEIGKLEAVRAIGLPQDLFIDAAPRVVQGWRARASVEAPSHLRRAGRHDHQHGRRPAARPADHRPHRDGRARHQGQTSSRPPVRRRHDRHLPRRGDRCRSGRGRQRGRHRRLGRLPGRTCQPGCRCTGKRTSVIQQPEQSPGFLLWHVTLRWQRDVTATLKPLGLTHVQFVLLATAWWLNTHDQQPSQVSLATEAGTDVKMASQVIRTLEHKGLITRETRAADTRARRLVVTDAGATLAPRAIEAVEAVDRALLAPLSTKVSRDFTAALRQLRQS